MRGERWIQTDLPQTGGNIHPCKLGLKSGKISGSDEKGGCRHIPRREYSFFSSLTDTEQIRVKNWNGQSARRQSG
jgi:hypothetical protein